MEQVDFYKLARPVQERFIGSINGGGLPNPILEHRSEPKEPRLWLALSGAAILLLVALYRVGRGDLTSRMAIHGAPVIAAYVLLIAAAVFGVLRALAVWGAVRALPFRAGIYVFPIGLIDARRHVLRVYKIEDLKSAAGPDGSHRFILSFPGGRSFPFTAKSPAQASAAEAALATAQGRVKEADAARDSIRPKALAALDPLQGYANPLVSSVPLSRKPPAWAQFAWLVALGAGVALGVSAWAVHNAQSDDKMYAAASTANDAASYRAYLARGTRHTTEVSKTLLPRAELREAERAGTVDAIEAYVKAHPGTAIGPEVQASLRAALLAELEAAKKAATLGALQEFARRHPDHHLEPELRAATHAVYAAALENYRKQANPKDPHVVAFVEKLVAYAERKGPDVQIRFRRTSPKQMEKADTQIAKSKFFKGVVSLPSRYFDAAHAHPHEDSSGRAIADRLQQAFPREILAFTTGPSIDDADAPLPAVTAPTLFIEHGEDWTGGLATSPNPRGVYIGIALAYATTFQIPDDAKPLRFKTTMYRGPEPTLAKDDEKPEEKIYDQIWREGFAQFDKRFLSTFFAR
jgi:hypothetical protein